MGLFSRDRNSRTERPILWRATEVSSTSPVCTPQYDFDMEQDSQLHLDIPESHSTCDWCLGPQRQRSEKDVHRMWRRSDGKCSLMRLGCRAGINFESRLDLGCGDWLDYCWWAKVAVIPCRLCSAAGCILRPWWKSLQLQAVALLVGRYSTGTVLLFLIAFRPLFGGEIGLCTTSRLRQPVQ